MTKPVVMDVDGTLTSERYDENNLLTLRENPVMILLALSLQDKHPLLISTARPEYLRPETEAWLAKHGLVPERIYMRPNDEEGVPDYSLVKNDKKMLFVEAKKLSIDIEQRGIMQQLAKYCFGEGMKYGVLTNGGVWMLVRSFEEGTTLAERVVWKVDIENDDLLGVVRRFNAISKDNVENIEGLVKKIQILDEVWRSLLDEPKEEAAEEGTA